MDYSLLEDIDNFVKEKGIYQSGICLSKNIFPPSLRKAMINEIAKSNGKMTLDDDIYITYDNSGHLALVATFSNQRSSLVVCDTTDNLDFPNDKFKFTKVKSSTIFEKAAKVDFRNQLAKELFEAKKEEFVGYPKEKVKEIIEKELKGIEKVLGDKFNYFKYSTIGNELKYIGNLSKSYCDNLNKIYLDSIKPKVIIYTQNESDVIRTNSKVSNSLGTTNERKNVVIPYIERQRVLNELNPMMSISCENSKTGEIDFECYLYRDGTDKYKMIAEPYNGIRYTKIFSFVTDGHITEKDFEKIIQKYLYISESDILDVNYAVRLSHTSVESYKNAVNYSITRDNEKYKINQYSKDKIDNLSADSIEISEKMSL